MGNSDLGVDGNLEEDALQRIEGCLEEYSIMPYPLPGFCVANLHDWCEAMITEIRRQRTEIRRLEQELELALLPTLD